MAKGIVPSSTLNRRHVLAAAATGFRDFVAEQGGDADSVLCSVGVAEKNLHDGTLGLDLGAYVAMMELAAQRTGNDNFGLWYGQQFRPEKLGLIGGIAIASATLQDALVNMAALFPYHQQATEVGFSGGGSLVRLDYRIADGSIVERRQDAELTLGMFVNVLRHCLGSRWQPEEVHCEHPRPDGWRAHEQAFAAPVYFGQRTNAIVFRRQVLTQPMPRRDAARLDQLRDTLLRVGAGRGLVSLLDQVRGEIRSRLPEGVPTIEAVADQLGLPRWTLQRRLADDGVSFSDLVDHLRQDLALRYIRCPSISIGEIADSLGYSEVSAFSRAFSRWVGCSPLQFRRTRLGVG